MTSKSFSQTWRLENQGRWAHVALSALAALSVHGCAGKQIRVHPWQASIYTRPIIPAPAPGYQPQYVEASAPDLPWDFPKSATSLSLARQPARPHVPAAQPPEATDARQPAALSLAPQLSAQEIAAAQSQMNESAAIARKNLDAAKGRTLNPTQSDLASKVASFLQESRDAARDGDWMRAKNLAKKAQVLSDELGASL